MQLEVMDYLLLERVSRNLAQVNKLLSAYTISSLSPSSPSFLADYPFLIICKDRADTLRKKVVNSLRQGFDRNVQGNTANPYSLSFPELVSSKLTIILKSYVILNMIPEIEQYYQENFLSPFLDSVITRVSPFPLPHPQERVDGDTRNSGNGFSMLLDTLRSHITHNCTAILQSSRDICVDSHPAFNFLLVSIWSPIVDYFFRRIPTIFVSPPNPDHAQSCGSHALFQRNFMLADGFLRFLAQLAQNPADFWNFQKTLDFRKKWEISFFSHRGDPSLAAVRVRDVALARLHDQRHRRADEGNARQGNDR